MHPTTLVAARRLFRGVTRRVARVRSASVVVCPPMLYLSDLINGYSGSTVLFGAQDISIEQKEGSFTGEVSGTMLKRAGVSYVIVGHSERRARGETDELVAQKVSAALAAGLTPVICVGEKERDEEGHYLRRLEQQIRTSLDGVTRPNAKRMVVAYEPIWAIGKTAADAMTPMKLHEMSLFVKKVLVKKYGRKAGSSIKILYGGSVEPENDDALIAEGGVEGFLVGHASLDAEMFASVVKGT